MIQEIAPYQYRNEYRPMPPEKHSILLCYEGRNILVKQKEGEISFLTFEFGKTNFRASKEIIIGCL